ncbi:MAG: TerC/Alx family metal homeostasis membrane protein [Bacteroidetes bacterium]|nr:TerC/Alx family metal homeostasis membrane protein [Bacteroidota bacterium]
MAIELFPFAEYFPFYIGFIVFVLLILLLDLGVFHKDSKEISLKEALGWSAIWVTLALVFNYLFYQYCLWNFGQRPEEVFSITGLSYAEAAKEKSLEFLAGFVVEKALAIDNIFIFVMIFTYFNIPQKNQYRVLFYGILGALFFRIIFISLGSVLLDYQWIIIFFGVFLILTGFKMIWMPETKIDPEKNPLIKLLKKYLKVTPQLEGDKFLIRKSDGFLYATPLFIALVFIELSDIIFAIDSVPAIFAITKEPFIVLTSNIFAILGLRAMYFALAGIVDKFWLLKYGLGLVLIFVGLKMAWLNDLYGGKFPIDLSLGIIGSLIGLSVLLSWLIKKPVKSSSN